jgi:hypothetical protein
MTNGESRVAIKPSLRMTNGEGRVVIKRSLRMTAGKAEDSEIDGWPMLAGCGF